MDQSFFDQITDRKDSDSIKWSFYGQDTIPLWVADMDFRSPPEVVEALKQRAEHGIFGYGDGYLAYREVFCARAERLFAWKVKPEEVRCVGGILAMLYLLVCHLSKVDEEIVLFTPAYPPFFKLSKQSARKLIECPLKESIDGNILKYEIDFEAFANLVTDKTKLLIFCNPYNPVGKAFSEEDLEKLSSFCISRGIIIISDELHSDLTLDSIHIPLASLSKETAENTITLCGPTKTFNLPGLKVGQVIVQNEKLRKELFSAAEVVVTDPSPLSIKAAKAAYQHGDLWLSELKKYLINNRDYSEKFIRENFPSASFSKTHATYLIWIKMDAYRSEISPFEQALKGKVAFGNGKHFGDLYENYLRLSLCSPLSILKEGLERFASAWR